MKKPTLVIGGGLVFLISLLLNLFLWQKTKITKKSYLVSQVIDGDTFILEDKQTIRLINVEAPELEFCGGSQAKEKLAKLIEGKRVNLEIISKDTFKRPLALVYQGDILVNEVLLKEGFVRYDGTPSPKRDELKKAYDYAFENRLGIHSPLCRAENPDNPKCLIKGNIDKHSNTKLYYFPGCANYQITVVEKDLGESWFCSGGRSTKSRFSKVTKLLW
ncbi:MAG: thermonuclease family protein [Microgenomates group bacterium]